MHINKLFSYASQLKLNTGIFRKMYHFHNARNGLWVPFRRSVNYTDPNMTRQLTKLHESCFQYGSRRWYN